jgi:hypothetical protein
MMNIMRREHDPGQGQLSIADKIKKGAAEAAPTLGTLKFS